MDRLGAAVKLVLKNHNIDRFVVDYEKLVLKYRNTSPYAENDLNYILHTGLGSKYALDVNVTKKNYIYIMI